MTKSINDTSLFTKKKFISVVTINFNNDKGLERTIDSVKKQINKSYFEYIIIDGNSDDNSIDVINKNKSLIDNFIIEKDEGIYDAMNKGISLAKSEYIIFLNSGDAFQSNYSLQNIYESHKELINLNNERPIAYYSDTILADGSIWKVKDPGEIWKGMICSHQSIAIDTNFLKKNNFNLGFSIVSDYEIISKAFLTGKPFHKIKFPISKIEPVVHSSNFKERTLERWLVNLRLFKKNSNKLSSINNYYSELLNNDIKSDIEKRIVFLISMPRSGSTLLQRLIESNNKVSSTGEPWIMLPIISIYDKEIIKASYNQDTNIWALKDFAKEINFSENLMVRSAQLNYIRSIYSTILETLKSEYYLDKTPRYVHIIDKLVEILPNSKYLILLREPEAIINSYATTWKNNNFKKVLSDEYFKYDFTHGFSKLFEFVESSFLNKKIVKYEDLVSNQEKIMRDIGHFLNLDFNQSFIFNSEKAKNRLMGDPKSINNQKKVFSNSVSSWKKNIDNSNLNDFLEILDLVPENAFNYYGKTKFESKLFVNQIGKNTSTKNASTKKYLTKGPTLGIILTCYNNSKDIINALNSVLNQTRLPDKIVIIDDKSTDSSVALIKEFINKNSIKKKCKLIVNEFNYGVGKSRDLAIKNCNTDYVTTLDGDDTIHPDKLKYEFEAIIRNNACIAFSDIELEFSDKKIVQNTVAYDKKSQRKLVELLLSRSAPVPRDLLFRKTCYKNVGGFIHGFDLYEDWLLKIRLTKFCGTKGWVHSGKIGTIYNKKNPGLSKKSKTQLLWQQIKVICLNKYIISRNIKNYSYISINFLNLAKNLPLPNFKNYLELLINDIQSPVILKNFLDPKLNSILDFSIKNEKKRFSDEELFVYLEKYFSPISIE